jgi:hypothetical protein
MPSSVVREDENTFPTFTGVKVFSATKMKDRNELGDKITVWLDDHPNLEVVDKVVTLSSDATFHCLAITIFYRPGYPISARPSSGAGVTAARSARALAGP